MSKIVQKWRKAMKGCAVKSPKESLIDNDYLQPVLSNDEFNFEKKETNFKTQKFCSDSKFPIYNDYDNLQHQTLPKHLKNKSILKDTTNSNTLVKGFRRVFTSKSLDKSVSIDEKENIDLNNNNFDFANLNMSKYKENSKSKSNKIIQSPNEMDYCEIPDQSNFFNDNDPLIDFKSNETKTESSPNTSNIKLTDSKINLFTKFENEEQENINQIPNSQSLNELREPETFVTQSDAFNWYLNLIFETKAKCIKNDTNLNDIDRARRLNICTAHLLYARNFYEMRISNSPQLKAQLINVHPCMIALACLLDSDAVRIVESHSCSCDSYIYFFSTRLKFCAWKAKLYIILKRPKRSSIDRLTLIEELKSCHKIIQDKASMD